MAHNQQPLWVVYVSGPDLRTAKFANHNLDSQGVPENLFYSSVQWSGIQNSVELAESDVLLLIDSCSSETSSSDEGCGRTELIAACGFEGVANVAGRFSFTNALIAELRLLKHEVFTSTKLFYRILAQLQSRIPEARSRGRLRKMIATFTYRSQRRASQLYLSINVDNLVTPATTASKL